MIRKILSYLFLVVILIAGCKTIQANALNSQDIVEGFVEVKDAKLFYRTKGEGNPIIILHGGPGLTQDYLLPQMYKLSENNFVIFYDQRGCGKSTGEINSEMINIETFIDDLDAVRQAFGFKTVSVLGHSWGTFLAMHYAIVHPERIDKLILLNVHPTSSEEYSQFEKEWLKRMAPYQAEMAEIHDSQAFQNGDPDVVERYYRLEFRRFCYQPEKADLLSLRMTPIASINGLKVHDIISKNVLQKHFDLHAALKKLRMPTLIIHGDVDPIPSFIAKNAHEDIAGSQFILMKNCGHFPYVEAPYEFFKYIDGFLRTSMQNEPR